MCGFTGWVDFERDITVEAGRLAAMTASLAPRGPDESGTWHSVHAMVGHRRLAVVDIEGGVQPMVHEAPGGPVVLVYGGEVYNHEDLRRELRQLGHRFRTRSDTEVVLRSYLQWGRAAAERLVGMFAFAVWDGGAGELVLVRDRLGVKPLYYCEVPGGFLFGSEPKAILASGQVEPVIDADGVRELFSLVRTPGEAVFKGIGEVRPGHVLTVSRRGCSERSYWTLESREHEHDWPETVDATRQLLDEIVCQQVVADVPVCSLLSGGLDSSVVTALAQRAVVAGGGQTLRTFSVDFGTAEEDFVPDDMRLEADRPYAHRMARFAGTDHADVVLDAASLTTAEARHAPLRARDLPAMGEIDSSLYFLFKRLRQHSVVALSGEGADELFGGYRWFHERDLVEAPTFPWLAMARGLGRYSMFEPALAGIDMASYQADRYRQAIAAVPALAGEDPLERRMREVNHLHLTRFLPTPLERKHRMSMAVGLEVRVPYCDHRLVDYVFNVPWRLKSLDGREKSLLRAAAAGWLPTDVAWRRKSPFPSTQDHGYDRALRSAVHEVVADRCSPVLQFVRRSTVRAMAALPESASPAIRMGLERVVGMNDWLRTYGVAVRL
jgi:asparagine synthase (glutamine-hydrolysing)